MLPPDEGAGHAAEDPRVGLDSFAGESSRRYFAIYDADGCLEGELAYLLGKLRGTRSCALCDISHGLNPIGKTAWRKCQGIVARIEWLHLDEQTPVMREFTDGHLPCVVAQDANGFELFLSSDALAAVGGDFNEFEALFLRRLAELENQ